MRAHAVSFLEPRRVGLVPLDLPDVSPGQTLVRTLYSGISTGTELLAYRGELDPSMPLDEALDGLPGTFAYPFSYGYSCVGTVEDGDAFPRGTTVFAYRAHQDRFVAPAGSLVPVGDVAAREATLFPLVETALQVTLDAGAVLEEPVVVLGLGVVGVLVSLLLARAGAQVTAADPRPWRREVASSLGVDAVDPGDVGERSVSLVVEVSGNPDALAGALDLLEHEGEVLVASWYGQKPVTLPLGGRFHRRRLRIRSTQVSTIPSSLAARWTVERRRRAAQALLPGLPLAALATHTVPFEDAAAAFAALDRGEEGMLHVALSYEPAR